MSRQPKSGSAEIIGSHRRGRQSVAGERPIREAYLHSAETYLLSRLSCLLTALLIGLGAAAAVRGDTLTKTNGEVLSGKLISEDDKSVLFEAHMEGLIARVHIARSDIKTLQREATAGPGYYPLPIEGEIGTEVTAAILEEALEQVRATKPDFVVLVINSPGGSIGEMFKIIQVIRGARDLRIVAYVERAISAASIIALSCPRLYMAEGGTIGAATPWRLGPDGTPEDVEAKFRSAFAGEARSIAGAAGHSPLLASAMIDPGVELAVVTGDSGPKVAEVGADGVPQGGTMLKKKGAVLTLTGKEALACGLASGTAAGVADLGKTLGPGVWHRVDDLAWNYMRHQAALARKQAERAAYLRSVAPELEQLHVRVDTAAAQGNAAADGLAAMQKDHDAEMARIDKQYDDAIKTVPAGADKQEWTARAAQAHDAAAARLEEKYRQPVEDLQRQYREAKAEFELAKGQYDAVVAAGP